MFFVAILLAITVGHLYLWKRLVLDTLRGWPARIAGAAALLLLATLLLTARNVARVAPPAQVRWLVWPGYIWLALVMYLTLALLALEVPRLAMRLRTRRTAAVRTTTAAAGPGTTVDRRLFLGRAMAATAGVVAAGTVGYGVRTVLAGPTLKHVTVPLRGLHPDLEGFRLAVVSDIHAGVIAGRAHVERIVNVVNSADAHAVSIVGDLQDGTVTNLRSAVAPLRDIVAREGAYFVTGNHEYFSDWHAWLREVGRLGIHALRNERTALTRGHGTFDLAGVNDVTGAEHHDAPDYAKALAGRDTGRPVVLMAHQPVQVGQAAAYGVDLQVSGHTHGGQMWPLHYIHGSEKWPLHSLAGDYQPSLAGLSRIGHTWLYVTRGAGFFGPPVRVGAPPDVTVITFATA